MFSYKIIMQVVHEEFGILEGLMTTVHATTGTYSHSNKCIVHVCLHFNNLLFPYRIFSYAKDG